MHSFSDAVTFRTHFKVQSVELPCDDPYNRTVGPNKVKTVVRHSGLRSLAFRLSCNVSEAQSRNSDEREVEELFPRDEAPAVPNVFIASLPHVGHVRLCERERAGLRDLDQHEDAEPGEAQD